MKHRCRVCLSPLEESATRCPKCKQSIAQEVDSGWSPFELRVSLVHIPTGTQLHHVAGWIWGEVALGWRHLTASSLFARLDLELKKLKPRWEKGLAEAQGKQARGELPIQPYWTQPVCPRCGESGHLDCGNESSE